MSRRERTTDRLRTTWACRPTGVGQTSGCSQFVDGGWRSEGRTRDPGGRQYWYHPPPSKKPRHSSGVLLHWVPSHWWTGETGTDRRVQRSLCDPVAVTTRPDLFLSRSSHPQGLPILPVPEWTETTKERI